MYLIERTLRSWVVRTPWILLLCKVVLLALTLPVAAQNRPDWTEYNVPFPSPPQDGASANKSFFQRANLSIEYLACGWENRFLPTVVDRTNEPTNFWQDDILGIVIAKLQWLKLGHTGCNGTHNVAGDFYSSMFPSVSSNQ